jgi:hypothetical protein
VTKLKHVSTHDGMRCLEAQIAVHDLHHLISFVLLYPSFLKCTMLFIEERIQQKQGSLGGYAEAAFLLGQKRGL